MEMKLKPNTNVEHQEKKVYGTIIFGLLRAFYTLVRLWKVISVDLHSIQMSHSQKQRILSIFD